jgi:hypothetical protein
MDDAIGLIIALVLLALLVGGIILPIVALVVSIRTRNKLNQQLSRLQGSPQLTPEKPGSFADSSRVDRARHALGSSALTKPPSRRTSARNCER